jgi:predicted RNase H-like HicB family nuclease
MHRYTVTIHWSDEDDAFVAEVPELCGCLAHGSTQEDALRSAQDAIGLWIDTAREHGDPVPEPGGDGSSSPDRCERHPSVTIKENEP